MPPLYDITVKHTFLDFKPVDLSDESESEQCFRQTLSCPCLSFLATNGQGVKTDSSGSQLPDVASSVSTDGDVPTSKAVNQKAVEKLHRKSWGEESSGNTDETQPAIDAGEPI
eukprot:s155_g25.t1